MLEFVDSGSYFAQDKNNLINPLIQDPLKKVPDPAGQKSTDPTGSGSSSLYKCPA